MGMVVVVVALAAMFGVPLVGIVLFVQWRAKKRMEAIRQPWSQLAQSLGGQYVEGSGFTGTQIHAHRGSHTLTVKMTLVSVMQAAGGVYYPDGGTFTEVIVQLDPRHGAAFVPAGTPTQTFVDHTRVPALAHLGPTAKIFLDTHSARIVFPGVCDNGGFLYAAAQSLEQMTQLVFAAGPLAAAA